MLSTYTSYQLVTKNVQSSLDRIAKQPLAAREIAYWKENIGKVKTADDFLNNSRLFNFAMKAHGLGDLAYAKGLIKKLLKEGTQDSSAMANRMADARYKEFAKTFDFQRLGPFTTGMPEALTGTVDKYLRQSLEENAGAENEGVRLALYFERKAPTIKGAMGILSDPALLKVVQTALNIPASTGTANIDSQAAMIERKLDIPSLKTPEGMSKFMKKFTAMWDVSSSQATMATGLPGAASMTAGMIGIDTLMSIARMRRGG